MKYDLNAPEFSTPLMKQFARLKEEAHDALLFFRMGDFYELFADDAVTAAPILGITLTSRDKKSENPMPMAGIPFHSATNYIQKLLNNGKKVAIAEQMVPDGMLASEVKGIVERKIIRTFSPAVQFEIGTGTSTSFLGILTESKNKKWTLSLFDPSTGSVRLSQPLLLSEVLNDPLLLSIQHFLFQSSTPEEVLSFFVKRTGVLVEEVNSHFLPLAQAKSFLETQYDKKALHPLLQDEGACHGLGILIKYVLKSQQLERLPHLHEPKPLHDTDRVVLGPHTETHLDLNELFDWMNSTVTSMGRRYLEQELRQPLKTVASIELRQAGLKELHETSLTRDSVQDLLKEVYDLERILGRVATELANPRDTYALGKSIGLGVDALLRLENFKTPIIRELYTRTKAIEASMNALSEKIVKEQRQDSPVHTREGGIFNFGANAELDHWLKLTTDGEKFLLDLEERERVATGISSLKVKYNRVFGYFIEISASNLKNVPAHYQRKQTMVGGERFFTEELKKFEEEILVASQKQCKMEASLFQDLIKHINLHSKELIELASLVAELDAFTSLSRLASKSAWCFPKIDDSFNFKLEGSRHAVVEAMSRGQFVPNDISFDPETARTLVITGPNMGGKSTLMRQLAQIIILGQIGAPVPARAASWGVFDSIYTRIGAHDAISQGQSTFMVEMVELGHILHHAGPRSFVILDEVGRGTSTFDGMSVASAALEHLHVQSKARIVFATHYHELTDLEARLPGVKNTYMKVLEEKGKLQFLYELAEGRSSKSFGIQVAELAGLPKAVIKKSWEILKSLEANNLNSARADSPQLSLFSIPAEETVEAPVPTHETPEMLAGLKLREEILALDLNQMRPIEALNALNALKEKLL